MDKIGDLLNRRVQKLGILSNARSMAMLQSAAPFLPAGCAPVAVRSRALRVRCPDAPTARQIRVNQINLLKTINDGLKVKNLPLIEKIVVVAR